jgi:hypothetical protein
MATNVELKRYTRNGQSKKRTGSEQLQSQPKPLKADSCPTYVVGFSQESDTKAVRDVLKQSSLRELSLTRIYDPYKGTPLKGCTWAFLCDGAVCKETATHLRNNLPAHIKSKVTLYKRSMDKRFKPKKPRTKKRSVASHASPVAAKRARGKEDNGWDTLFAELKRQDNEGEVWQMAVLSKRMKSCSITKQQKSQWAAWRLAFGQKCEVAQERLRQADEIEKMLN